MAGYKPFKFNPIKDLGLSIPKDRHEEALAAAAEYIKEAMLERIGNGESPVAGGKWVRGLTPDYKKAKGEFSSVKFANLEKEGTFLDSLDVSADSKRITVSVGEDQEGKAEGFLLGLYGANAKKEYKREFMPTAGKTFKRDILAGIKDLLKEFEDDGQE